MMDFSDNGNKITNLSPYLKELELEIYTEGDVCQIGNSEDGVWGHDSNFCAKPVQVLDDQPCRGDSGGPLFAKVRFHFLPMFYSYFYRRCTPVP